MESAFVRLNQFAGVEGVIPFVIERTGHPSAQTGYGAERARPFSPNPPKDTDGRREDSGRGWVRELQGRWPGVLG